MISDFGLIHSEEENVRTIHHVVDFDADLATVPWSAVTERDRLASWWSSGLDTTPAAVGARLHWTFVGDFNPVMEITTLEPLRRSPGSARGPRPVAGQHFRFELEPLHDGRTRLRFWQDYATEFSDDAYGTYNFNWGYYLESLRLLCTTGVGKPFHPPAVTRGLAPSIEAASRSRGIASLTARTAAGDSVGSNPCSLKEMR